MANHKSAIKAHRQNAERRSHNREMRTRMRSSLKLARSAVDSGDAVSTKKQLQQTTSLLDKLVSKGVLHTNTAARYKSRLIRRLAKNSAPA